MSDAVDRLIEEREAMDHGMEGGFVLSVAAHILFIAGAIFGPMLLPGKPPLIIADGFVVPMPPGGGGPRTPDPAPAPAADAKQPEAPPAPEPPPKLIKPPSSKAEPKTKGLPAPDAKKVTKKPKPDDTRAVADAPANPASKPASGGTPGATGKNSVTPGLEFGPPGPGVPTGTDIMGDWYLAGVQRKIWSIWNQQLKDVSNYLVTVRFTILSDGKLDNVEVVKSSGTAVLDLAAQRAVYSAAPFGPLPKTYGTDRITIQATFKPTL
jgi:periplasmic protein TonB